MRYIYKCPLCTLEQFKLLYELNSDYRIVKCKVCGFVFRNPQPTEEEINNFYTKEYYLGTADYKYQDERNDRELIERYSQKIETLHKIKKYGRLLDIGYAFGVFLKIASKYYEPYGVEISEYASNYAKNQGLICFNGRLEQAKYPDNYFDIVNMVEVIEHLPDPQQTVQEIYRIMKPTGILIIKTSNIESLYAKLKGKNWDYLLPGHLCYFSVKTLNRMLTSNNFQIIDIIRKLKREELIRSFGIQSYVLSLLLYLKQISLANYLIRGMTFFVKK